MAKPTITIWRKGTFKVPGLVAENKCGLPGQTEFAYRVEMTVRQLDSQGFVCDNFNVPQAFENKFGTGRWEASCEQLAGGAVHMMRKLCGGRAIKVVCEVSPIADAGVKVEWNDGDEMPDFYPIRLPEVVTVDAEYTPAESGIVAEYLANAPAGNVAVATAKRGRGRPKGSKNKAKVLPPPAKLLPTSYRSDPKWGAVGV